MDEPVLVEKLERSLTVYVKIGERLVESLDRLAHSLGYTRSDLIRSGAKLPLGTSYHNQAKLASKPPNTLATRHRRNSNLLINKTRSENTTKNKTL